MLSGKLRNDGPDILRSGFERIAQSLDRRGARRRPIHQRDNGGVAPAIKHFVQPDLQGTELAAAGIGIDTIEAPLA